MKIIEYSVVNEHSLVIKRGIARPAVSALEVVKRFGGENREHYFVQSLKIELLVIYK